MNRPVEVCMIGDFTRNHSGAGFVGAGLRPALSSANTIRAGLRPAPTRRAALAAVVWAFLAFAAGCAQAMAAEMQPLHSQKTGWQLLPQYSDEFGEATLDIAKRDNDVKDWGVWSWVQENASVSSGQLNLRMDYREHKRGWQALYYKSGIVKSKAPPLRYGYFEARIKAASRYPGVGPAFWGYRKDAGKWTELDVTLSPGARAGLKKQVSPLGFPTTAQVDYVRVWSLTN